MEKGQIKEQLLILGSEAFSKRFLPNANFFQCIAHITRRYYLNMSVNCTILLNFQIVLTV
jgi:hypothetical protein